MNTRTKTLLLILWPFRMIFRIVKWLFSSYFGEFFRAKKERTFLEGGGSEGADF